MKIVRRSHRRTYTQIDIRKKKENKIDSSIKIRQQFNQNKSVVTNILQNKRKNNNKN